MRCTGNSSLTHEHFHRSRLPLFDNLRSACHFFVRSVFIPVGFCTLYAASSVGSVIMFGVAGADVTLFTDIVLRITFSSNVTVSDFINMTLNGPTVFGNNFVCSALEMHADLIKWTGGLSTKTICPRFNFGVCQVVLS